MPTKTKAVVIPADPNDLICDTCPERFAWKGDMLRTFEAARVKGWHIYAEMSATASREARENLYTIERVVHNIKALCPECVGTPRSKLPPAPAVLEGQADILEDLGIEAEPVQREKKPPKRGVN